MKPSIAKKIGKVDALKGKSIADVCAMPEYREVLETLARSQQELRKTAKEAIAKARERGLHLTENRHVIDRIDFDTDTLIANFLDILNKVSRLPRAERDYIAELGMLAFRETCKGFIVAQFPELKDEFYPPKKSN